MKVLKVLGYVVLVLGLNSCTLFRGTIELASVLNLLPIDLEAYLWYIHRDYSLMNIFLLHLVIFSISGVLIVIANKPKLLITFLVSAMLYFFILPICEIVKYNIVVPKYEKLSKEILKKFPQKKLNASPSNILGFNAVHMIEDSVQKDVEASFAKEMDELNLYHILVNDSTVYFVKYTSWLGMEAIAFSNCDLCGGEVRQGKAYALPCKKISEYMYDISFFDS